jgi:hypothetical protein
VTGRRSIAQWDAKLSRAMQFVPGHVTGRVNSAQPVVRRHGIGVAGAPVAPVAFCSSSLFIDSGTTWAEYGPASVAVHAAITFDYDATHTGDIDVRIASITADPADPPTLIDTMPSEWMTITGPGTGSITFKDTSGEFPVNVGWSSGAVLKWRIEWDVAGAFTTGCSESYEEA